MRKERNMNLADESGTIKWVAKNFVKTVTLSEYELIITCEKPYRTLVVRNDPEILRKYFDKLRKFL